MLRGVNLGGWFVLERWITPSLFNGSEAVDEYSLSKELGSQAQIVLDQHYRTFITAEDFKWISSNGLNVVRIPVGYWLFGDEPPFVGSIKYLDLAMEQAAKNDLKVVIDLHGAPGSQNSWQHSGRQGKIKWPKQANVNKSLDVIKRLSERYKKASNLYGIELINEPHWLIGQKKLLDYYHRGYEIIRNICGPGVAVIFSDAFQPKKWIDLFPVDFENIFLDMHLYQVFSAKDKRLNAKDHIDKASEDWALLIEEVQSDTPAIIGEWSIALDPQTKGLDEQSLIEYGGAQLKTFERSAGWFYWTYKTENLQKWSYRDCIEKGWLPVI